jgi:flagellar basal-body rod protein FlgF
MIKGVYSSGSGMQPRMMRLDVISNNLANIDTAGFKRDNLFIKILKDKGTEMAQGKGELAGMDVKQYTDFSEGSLRQTGNQLDMAIIGNGFFSIDTPNGIRYTRNGNFMLAVDGTVVTNQGYPVLGSAGKIQLPDVNKLAQGDISISETGDIFVDKNSVGKLRVVTFDDLTKLKKDKSSSFVTDEPERPVGDDSNSTIIRQGFLEESNVDGIEEMITMIELGRSFESDQKAIQAQDSTLEKAMEVGRM